MMTQEFYIAITETKKLSSCRNYFILIDSIISQKLCFDNISFAYIYKHNFHGHRMKALYLEWCYWLLLILSVHVRAIGMKVRVAFCPFLQVDTFMRRARVKAENFHFWHIAFLLLSIRSRSKVRSPAGAICRICLHAFLMKFAPRSLP